MDVKAKAKYIRMSPRKVRLVVNLVKNLKVNQALDQLKFINKKAAEPVEKLLKSAIANAEHNFNLQQNNLVIKKFTVDEGPTLHRFMPRAHGRATPIRKKDCHLNLVLGEIIASKVKTKKIELEAPVKLETRPKAEAELKIKQAKEKGVKPGREKVERSIAPAKEKTEVDVRTSGRIGHSKIEGGSHKRGFVSKIFRRKSG